jgi:hypothetical protein
MISRPGPSIQFAYRATSFRLYAFLALGSLAFSFSASSLPAFRPVSFSQTSYDPQLSSADSAGLEVIMPRTAQRVLREFFQSDDRRSYLNNLFRLQMVAGMYAAADTTIAALRPLAAESDPQYSDLLFMQYELFNKAQLASAASNIPFDSAFSTEFRRLFHRIDDKSALHISMAFISRNGISQLRDDFVRSVRPGKKIDSLNTGDAINACKNYHVLFVFEQIEPVSQKLLKEDDNRRYIIQDSLLIPTADGGKVSSIVVRKRDQAAPQPAALFFNIYTDFDLTQAKIAAAHGYIGVAANPRGKRLSPDEPDPYEHEREDSYAVIDWLSKQPWCNGSVGMYGGSYTGYAQWAAAKVLHPALKTIVPYVANNPGDGLPMENNVFLFVNYAWPFYVANNKYLDNATYGDRARWNALNDKWYQSGAAYRTIDSIDGTPNKWFHRWISHPDYDAYWQKKVPYREEFADINIPVLTITGYYDDGQQSAIRYLKEHYTYNKKADHYLLIGPYDHFGSQSPRKPSLLKGYAIDSVAQMDTPELTFQWFDYVLRGGPKPSLLQDKINYEIMGANRWAHAASIDKMADGELKLYLTEVKSGDRLSLSSKKPARRKSLPQTVDFADRKTQNNDYYPDVIAGKRPDLSNGYAFISEPFTEPVDICGMFSGVINAKINKKDMDIGLVLYEVTPAGELFHLSYIIQRASYAKDMTARKLLTPGKIESIPFEKTRMVCKRLSPGSRLLVTLNVNKNPYAQINYGTGKDVSLEDISDAKIPLEIEWQNDSFVRIPIRKEN